MGTGAIDEARLEQFMGRMVGHMTGAAGLVEYDPEADRYSLSAEAAMALADDSSPVFVARAMNALGARDSGGLTTTPRRSRRRATGRVRPMLRTAPPSRRQAPRSIRVPTI